MTCDFTFTMESRMTRSIELRLKSPCHRIGGSIESVYGSQQNYEHSMAMTPALQAEALKAALAGEKAKWAVEEKRFVSMPPAREFACRLAQRRAWAKGNGRAEVTVRFDGKMVFMVGSDGVRRGLMGRGCRA